VVGYAADTGDVPAPPPARSLLPIDRSLLRIDRSGQRQQQNGDDE
jgi:hypothetical protein